MTPHDEMRWYAARRDLSHAMYQLSQEVRQSHQQKQVRPMSITGASHLSNSIRDMIAQAKARIEQAHSTVAGSIENLNGAAVAAEDFARAINAEANNLMSELGQSTNGGPPLDDPKPTPVPFVTLALDPLPEGEPKKNEGSL